MSTSVMKLGFVSAILPEWNLSQVLGFARAEKFDCVELMCWPKGRAERRFAGVTHIDVDGMNRTRAEDVLGLVREHQVGISALGYYPNPLDPDPEVSRVAVAHLKKVIRASALLGIGHVNTFVGRDWTKSVDENWPRFLRVWKPLVAYAEDHGVKVGIENCPMLFTRDEWPGGKNLATNPVIWRRMFSDIPSSCFGLNFDPSHLVLQHMDPARPLKEFAPRFFHFHAKDVRIDRGRRDEVGIFDFPLRWHQPRIPGYGDIDWARFMGSLMETGYRGPVCIEVEDDTFGKSLEGRLQAVCVARNVLRPYLSGPR